MPRHPAPSSFGSWWGVQVSEVPGAEKLGFLDCRGKRGPQLMGAVQVSEVPGAGKLGFLDSRAKRGRQLTRRSRSSRFWVPQTLRFLAWLGDEERMREGSRLVE